MKRNLVLMIIIAVMLVGGLTFIGYNLTSKNKAYYDLENKLKEAAEVYCGQYPGVLSNNLLILHRDKLIEENFLKDFEANQEKCEGYVEIKKNNMFYDYKAYIKCNNYETKNYSQAINEGV